LTTQSSSTLARWFNKQWNRFSTAVFFIIFGSGGLLLSITLLPIIRLAIPGEARRHRWGLALVRLCFYWFTRGMRWTQCIRFQTIGTPPTGPCLYVANHPTLIDVVVALGQIQGCNCLVKKSLFRNRFIGSVLTTAGLLPNDAGPLIIELTRREFEAGHGLLVFPEGTRSPNTGIHPFSRGAAQIAVRNKVPIAPVLISCDPPILKKGQPWHQIADRTIYFKVQFFPPLSLPPEIENETTIPLKVRKLNRYLEQWFTETLKEDELKRVE